MGRVSVPRNGECHPGRLNRRVLPRRCPSLGHSGVTVYTRESGERLEGAAETLGPEVSVSEVKE